MVIRVESEYNFGEIVYLKTDMEQRPRIVIAMLIDGSSEPIYKLAQSTSSDYHYGREISREKDIILTTTN